MKKIIFTLMFFIAVPCNTFAEQTFKPITEAEAVAMNSIDSTAAELYRQLLVPKGKEEAIAEAVKYYKSQDIVKEVGVSVSSVWVIYTNGITGGFSFGRAGYK